MNSAAPSSGNASDRPGNTRRWIRFLYEDRFFWLAIILVFAFRLYPQTSFLMWPFSQLGTLVHELFHGLSAILSGGEFLHMTVYQEGGGVAWIRNASAWQRAFTAAGGLVGPSILGAVILLLARRFGITSIMFALLSFFFLVVAFVWSKGGYTVGLSLVVAVVFFVIAIIPHHGLTRFFAMFIPIQLAFENLIDFDYMFTDSFLRNGTEHVSDTGIIARQLGGTFWMWGMLIAIVTLATIVSALYFSAPKVSDTEPEQPINDPG